MGDVFLEQIVKKKNRPIDYVKKFFILFAGIVICIIGLVLVTMSEILASFFMLIAAGGIYFGWLFSRGLNLEFEYIYTNGEIDFDQISNKRKRKRLVTIRISSFEEFGEFTPETLRSRRYDRVIDASVNRRESGNYFASFWDKEGKHGIIIFTPNEKLLEEINTQYRRHVLYQRAHEARQEGGAE